MVELLDDSAIETGDSLMEDCATSVFQQCWRGYLSLNEVRHFVSSCRETPVSLFEIDSLSTGAVEIPHDSGAIVYDVLLLALAEEDGTVVVTARYKLLQALRGTPYHRLAHYLADVGSLVSGTKREPRAYCNRTATFSDTHWYTMDKATLQDHRKPHKQAPFPDTLGRA